MAGEAGWGGLRYVLARGVSRSRLLASKAAVAGLFAAAAVTLLPAAVTVAGMTSIFAFSSFLSTVTSRPGPINPRTWGR